MSEWKRPSISHPRPPTTDELDRLYAAIGTTRQAAHTRAAQRANTPRPRRRTTP